MNWLRNLWPFVTKNYHEAAIAHLNTQYQLLLEYERALFKQTIQKERDNLSKIFEQEKEEIESQIDEILKAYSTYTIHREIKPPYDFTISLVIDPDFTYILRDPAAWTWGGLEKQRKIIGIIVRRFAHLIEKELNIHGSVETKDWH